MQYIALILFFLLMLFTCGIALWWFLYCKSKPKYNGFLWKHPDLGGNVIDILKNPFRFQNPFYFNYRLLEFGLPYFRQPLYLWKQDKITDSNGVITYPIVPWEPKEPADFGLQSTPDSEPDKSHPYITPNELFETTDWQCLHELETSKSGITEALKMGMSVIMVCVCIFGIIVALDMIGKKDTSQPVQTASKPTTMIIQPQNYGGLK